MNRWINGLGLAIGVSLGGVGVGNADYASKLSDKGRRAGLLVTSEDDALTMLPNVKTSSAGYTETGYMLSKDLSNVSELAKP